VRPETPGQSTANVGRLLSSQSGGWNHPDDTPGADGTPGPHPGGAADEFPIGQYDCPLPASQNQPLRQSSGTPSPLSVAKCGTGPPTSHTWSLAVCPTW